MSAEYLLKRAIMEENGFLVRDDKFVNSEDEVSFLCTEIENVSVHQVKMLAKETQQFNSLIGCKVNLAEASQEFSELLGSCVLFFTL